MVEDNNIRTPEDDVTDMLIDEMHLGEYLNFRLHLDNESDRGCALMAAAFLDELLKDLLKAYLIDDSNSVQQLFSGTGALGTFSSRIELCYLLGLISASTKRDLTIIRKIRNDFAHVMDIIDFNHPPIASRCSSLHNYGFSELPPRKAFNRVAFAIGGLINGARMTVERRQPREDFNFSSEEFKQNVETTGQLMGEILKLITVKTKDNNPST